MFMCIYMNIYYLNLSNSISNCIYELNGDLVVNIKVN